MRPIVSMTLAACAVVLMTSPILAQAQTPAPAASPPAPPPAGGTPDAMPFDIPYGQSIGLELAKQAVAITAPARISNVLRRLGRWVIPVLGPRKVKQLYAGRRLTYTSKLWLARVRRGPCKRIR